MFFTALAGDLMVQMAVGMTFAEQKQNSRLLHDLHDAWPAI